MAREIKTVQPTRRYVRVRGPFDGCHLGLPKTPVLIYDLNVGGGFVSFIHEQPTGYTLVLKIDLPWEGPITVNAETVYRLQSGVAVRFVDVDAETRARLERTVVAMKRLRPDNAEPNRV